MAYKNSYTWDFQFSWFIRWYRDCVKISKNWKFLTNKHSLLLPIEMQKMFLYHDWKNGILQSMFKSRYTLWKRTCRSSLIWIPPVNFQTPISDTEPRFAAWTVYTHVHWSISSKSREFLKGTSQENHLVFFCSILKTVAA